MILAFAIVGILIALLPAGMFLSNLPLFEMPMLKQSERTQPPDKATMGDADSAYTASVLIPARDEANGISDSIKAALDSRDVCVEVVVLDDHSTDHTAEIVKRLAETDTRVRYVLGKPLPPAWNGKQHACFQLAQIASYDRLVFLDADVRMQPDGLATLAAYQDATGVDLLSAFPHQETGTLLEIWMIPMMHYVLLGFLPLNRMRASTHPSYAAGCGQLFMTCKDAYRRSGTHEAIRSSRHDGLKLPRIYRKAGLMSDVVDGTQIADCRMYHSAGEVIRGLLKNAEEGIANPRLIVPFSILLLGSSVLPMATLIWALATANLPALVLSIVGVLVGHFPRAIAGVRFRQSPWGVLFHWPATLLFVLLQWIALGFHLLGIQVAWRGRTEV